MTKIKTKSAAMLMMMSVLGVVVLGGADVNVMQRLPVVAALMFGGVIFAALATYISAKNPQKSLFEIIDARLKTPVKLAVRTIFLLSALMVASVILTETTRFFGGTMLVQTPLPIIGLFLVLAALYLAKSGALTLAKWAILAVFAGAATFLLITIFTLRLADFENLSANVNGANFSISNLNFLLIIALIIPMILMVNGDNHHENKPYKSILIAGGAAIGVILLILLRDVLVLGAIIESLPFPSHSVARLARHSTSVDISPIASIVFAAMPIGLLAFAIFTSNKCLGSFAQKEASKNLIITLLAAAIYLLSQILLLANFNRIVATILIIFAVLNFINLLIVALFCKRA